MISRFFIDRPIFAAVLSILITLAGGIAVFTLPLAQFPSVSPPTVQVTCAYPGASAQDVAGAVAAPIEQQVNGVENMLYMSSACTNDGNYSLTVTFKHGVDLNMAQVLVQNRVALAVPSLPNVIKQTGVTVLKRSPDILMGLALTAPDGRFNQLYVSNYSLMQVKDELARLEGVGDVFIFGQRDFSMRIWVDPDMLAARGLTASDVVDALREQNAQVATGSIGQQPAPNGQDVQITLSTLGRLSEVDQFENIILRTTRDGRVLRLKHVARVELGAKSQDVSIRLDGKDAVFVAIFQMPDANALETHDRVMKKMDELQANFPEGLAWEVAFDTTPYTRESIKEVFKTLRDAVILVAVVVLLFLQNWRSSLIPLVAVPVAIVGTFAAMAAFGFSLNNLTLFGLVLAIGIVVDDAIVVVEAVEHHIENGLTPHAATIKAMDQVSGPVIAVGLVLSAVFVPCAFISGITGQFFRQFALTISVSTIISAFNSLTLSPALTAVLLRPRDKVAAPPLPRAAFALGGAWLGWEFLTPRLEAGLHAWRPAWSAALPSWAFVAGAVFPGLVGGYLVGGLLNRILGLFFRTFNRGFDRATRGYTRAVGGILGGRLPLVPILFTLIGGWVGWELTVPELVIRLSGHGPLIPVAPGFSIHHPVGVWGVLDWEPVTPRLPERVASWIPDLYPRLPGWALPAAGVFLGLLAGGLFGAGLHRLMGLIVRASTRVAGWYAAVAGRKVRVSVLALGSYALLLALTGWDFAATPKGFIPNQDMGYLLVNVQLPDSASVERTNEVMAELVRLSLETPGIRHASGITGQSFVLNAYGSNFGTMFINLKDYSERRSADLSSDAIAQQLRMKFGTLTDAMTAVFGPPPVRGAGRAGGFMLMVEDRGDIGPAALQEQTENLGRRCNSPETAGKLLGVFSVFRANVPQLLLEPDPNAITARGVGVQSLSDTVSVYEGSLYVNDFNLFGRTWQVIVQADGKFRHRAENLPRLKARNAWGGMVPLGSVGGYREVNGPLVLTRYNMYPAASINGNAAPGMSSGDVMALINRLAKEELPNNMSFEWTDMSYLELLAGNTAMIIFTFAVVMVFLVLAAQYESWSLPLAIILVVPLCLLSALVGVNIAHMDVNIFTQIGFVVLVGLASKNAILIVEFAKQQRHEGRTRREATLAACQLRLRPIIMTSLAFILGVLPLMVSHGAGAEMRRTLGTAVFSGMVGVTLFGIFLTPVFFFVIDWLGETPLFTSPLMRRTGAMSLELLSFRFLGRMGALLRRRPADGIAVRPLPPREQAIQPK